MDIDGYFEMYLKNRIEYDRMYHIKNMESFDLTKIDKKLVEKIFKYLDDVLFGGKMYKYCKDNGIKLEFKVSRALTSTAGMFYHQSERIKGTNNTLITVGIKISIPFFQKIIDENIINMNIGAVDQYGKKILSTTTIEPLITTMEHEMMHMLLWMTQNNKFSDVGTVKSGHTKNFKTLVYNIFGHNRVTHGFNEGDLTQRDEIKNNLELGMYVKNKKKNVSGYIVQLKDKYAVICTIDEKKGNKYSGVPYIDIEIDNSKNMNIKGLLNKLKSNQKIMFKNKTYIINSVKSTTIRAMDDQKKYWNIPKLYILDINFL